MGCAGCCGVPPSSCVLPEEGSVSVSETYSAALAATLRMVSTALLIALAVAPRLDGGRSAACGAARCIETGALDLAGGIAEGLRMCDGSGAKGETDETGDVT